MGIRILSCLILVGLLIISPVSGEVETDDPVRVNSNDELAEVAEKGNGTAGNPWVIEGLTIEGLDHGIYIGNVTEHFIIRDCYLKNVSELSFYENSEIMIFNSENGVIENNRVVNMLGHGINIVDSSDIEIVDNEIIGETVMDSVGHGIRLYRSERINVRENHVEGNRDVYTIEHGILAIESTWLNITDNHVEGNDMAGIGLFTSDYNRITGNLVEDNSWGILLEGSRSNHLIENILLKNGWGIYLEEYEDEEELEIWSHNNTIYHNDFVRNGHPAWDSYGKERVGINQWDNGSHGNYWSDYRRRYPDEEKSDGIWLTPYEIPGTEEKSSDSYPLVEPISYGEEADEPTGTSPVWWVLFGFIIVLILLRAVLWVRERLGVKVER